MQSAATPTSGGGGGVGGAATDSSLELDVLLDDDDDEDEDRSGPNRKPHFLDYDNKPPAGLESQVVFPRPTQSISSSQTGEDQQQVQQPQQQQGQGNRGTWPAAATSGTRHSSGGRQNQSMYGDMSEVCPKMECVYSLLSMLGSTNSLEMSAKFVELSRNRETCSALRRSGCIPLLVQIIHNDPNETARRNARQSLNNVIGCHPDDKAGRREVKVLKLIEQLVDYSDQLRSYSETSESTGGNNADAEDDPEKHPIAAITTLMKISFDEEHRHAMCQLGALQTISTLIQLDHAVHGTNNPGAPKCVTMRRYAGMILTNLTFGDGNNKSLLCSNKGFMRALVAQIGSSSDELVQVTASVLRNLSWRADSVIKQTLSEIGTVAVLARAAMSCRSIENTLKAILSALWNLSNHCPPNRSEFCEVPGALEFLIDMLSYEAPSKTMHVIENAGGILRNISSHVAGREDYRRILRRKNCLKILLEQLKSPSLTVVSNACGTLGSLSGDCPEDQRFLRENGAIPMLRSLIYSKHKMISNGSSMALKNLLKPSTASSTTSSSVESPAAPLMTPSGPTSDLPSLNARKKKALEQELEEKFLPKSSPEEKDICTVRGTTPPPSTNHESDDNSEEDSEPVSHSAVHIRLVAPEPPEEPVNYSLKEEEASYQEDYQETDIDQITDYSLRYAENQSESESADDESDKRGGLLNHHPLMPEDSVRCYYTEGTPQIISSATSMSDLRNVGGKSASQPSTVPTVATAISKSEPIPIKAAAAAAVVNGNVVASATPITPGCDTPDKPYNYCEEGTPDFSRDASLNVMEEMGGEDPKLSSTKPAISPLNGDPPLDADGDGVVVVVNLHAAEPPSTPGSTSHHNTSKQVSFLNTAEETPLMFSRTSSMGSLSSAEPALVCADDKSSIVSEFSRFPSGVISPSELPDSPTQSMPHSPRRNSGMAAAAMAAKRKVPDVPVAPSGVKSAFEDTVAKFEVENTPAAFSCATSLSNLSLEEREDQESKEVVKTMPAVGPPVLPVPEVGVGSDDDDGESDAGGDDDLLLESMVSMGMKKERPPEPPEEPDDQLRQFCTEDTPARLSEAPSNCDLSVLSFDTRNDTAGTGAGHDSDDSSNVSAEQCDRLLEECIRSGMPQPKQPKQEPLNPLNMMRRNPVHIVEPLYANDEVNNFYLEDSPYAFSTISGLSDLTVATEAAEGGKRISTLGTSRQPIPGPEPPRNGSLSSLSVESDADDRLLDEAIAAGIGSNKRPTTGVAGSGNRMTAAAVDGNDSLDSIDSVDSNDPQDSKLSSTKPAISPLNGDPPLDADGDGVVVVVNLHAAEPPSTPGSTSHHNTSKQVSFLNTAEETPLMFSRTSSMGSLSSAEPALVCADDKSSIVSEFSRFPSGVISPSELPDSPTQSMPHSPRRNSGMAAVAAMAAKRKVPDVPAAPSGVKSAFEDTVAKFEVENTPAAFSCATSLSNLSLEEREDQESKEVAKTMPVVGPPVLPVPEVGVGSDDDDGESDAGGDDDLLLESMVSMGMKKERPPEPPEEPDDQLRQFCTEDTPARLSEAPSNCDLSVLSFDTRNDTAGTGAGHDSDDSSNVSAEQCDRLLEECIRSGMPQPKQPKQESLNPLNMMRRNPVHIVEPLYANDEVNNFYLEDSPYAFSTISGLSDLTVATEAAEGGKRISTLGTSRQPIPGPEPPRNGSLSSLSVESDADDRLLDEAIAAGIGSNKRPTTGVAGSGNRMTAAAVDGNDSLDSIDSVDSNDPQGNSLLEQCIANGMKKPPAEKRDDELLSGLNVATQQQRSGASPFIQAQAQIQATAAADLDSIPDSDRDYDLLRECIARGMPRNSGNSGSGSVGVLGGGGVSTLELTQNLQRLAISSALPPPSSLPLSASVPKNGDTTPVVVTRPDAGAIRNVTSAGVVESAAAATTTADSITPIIVTTNGTTTTTITASRGDPERPVRQQPQPPQPHLLQQSGSELDRSNEFPAMMTSTNPLLVDSTTMQMSNEFTAADLAGIPADKHKDPDLMLKSVERLTQELVSTAASKAENCSSNNNNNNTWDEDVTCANDVSFPSLSVQAPRIQYESTASGISGGTSYGAGAGGIEEDDTATISDEIDSKALDALEHDTQTTPMNESRPPLPPTTGPTLLLHSGGFDGSNEDLSCGYLPSDLHPDSSTNEIRFQLGGEVQHPMVGGGGGGHFVGGPCSNGGGISFSTVSTLTNSTIIAMEATKVANQLQNLAIVESAEVDLSKINCPFGTSASDSILISDCSDSEMTFRNHESASGRKITIPAGLMARRALGQTTFNDSMNSLHNLDSIGPPSIMDELMDSMISVASITSEVAEPFDHNGHAGSSGNSSLTLNSNSSLENLIKFSPTMNAGMVVMKSATTTPTMSPKRAERRQAMKDRYKTYTIPSADTLLLGDGLGQDKEKEGAGGESGSGGEEVKTPTPSVPSTPSPKKSSRERRAENKSRYETQIITTSTITTSGSLPNGTTTTAMDIPPSPRTPVRATIIATPVAFSPLTLQSPAPMSLERVLSPEPEPDPEPEVDDDDPVTYTVQETRRKSFEQKLPTITSGTIAPTTPGPLPASRTPPTGSPSKMPTRIVAKINPPTPVPASTEPAVKAVRGTKKPAYVSPYRKSAPAVIARTPVAASATATTTVPVKPLATPKLRTQSSLVEPATRARPQPLRARSSLGSKRNSLELNGGGAGSAARVTSTNGADIPKIRERQPSLGAIGGAKAKVAPSPEPLLIRQGTFTKDEPSNPEVPVVTSAPSTPAKTARKPPPGSTSLIPSSASSSRLTTIAAKSRIVLHKSISMDASKTVPSTPTASTPCGPPSGESTPLTSRYRLTSARTSLVDYKKPNTSGGRLSSTPIRQVAGSEEGTVPATPTSPGSMIPMRRKSGIALPKRTNLTMKSNPDVLKGKLEGVRNAFVRTAASGVKTGSR